MRAARALCAPPFCSGGRQVVSGDEFENDHRMTELMRELKGEMEMDLRFPFIILSVSNVIWGRWRQHGGGMVAWS